MQGFIISGLVYLLINISISIWILVETPPVQYRASTYICHISVSLGTQNVLGLLRRLLLNIREIEIVLLLG